VIINNYNKKNKVFLGDSGSLFLGTLISIYIMHIFSNSYVIQEQFDVNKILYVLGIYAYPTIDFIRVIIMRLIAGKSPFQADKTHIHHNLIKRGISHLSAVFLILISSIFLLLIIQLIF
jgi:UDP-N-acetylmuramyl pentapeptide phosphotransferase/UDP-N-acetylglucosamine-1-phosphate transferase